MRLYTDEQGQWFGTQADARRNAPRVWKEVDVPVAKQELLEFLNSHTVGKQQQQQEEQGSTGTRKDPEAAPVPELLSEDAESWVAWALDNLTRGDTKSAKEMLIKGLTVQRQIVGGAS